MSNRFARAFVVVCLGVVVLYGSSCDDFFVSGSSLDHITVTPTSVYLQTNETKQFSASAVTVDGATSDITDSASWSTGSTGTATVNGGLVTAIAAGNTVVTAAKGGTTGTANVVVGLQALSNLNITPSPVTLAAGRTQQLAVQGTLADNTNITLTNFVSWSSSNTSNATVSRAGLVSVPSGVASGQMATITAVIATSSGTSSGSVTVTVQ